MFVSMVLLLTFVMKEILSDEGFCEDCLTGAASGFCPYPGDCTKYVQCQAVGDTFNETIQSCPFGQFWDADREACRPSFLVRCEADPCRNLSTGFTYGMTGYGCRAYWKCLDGVSVAHCCPQGFVYVEGIGCVVGQCDEKCPPDVGNPMPAYKLVQRRPF